MKTQLSDIIHKNGITIYSARGNRYNDLNLFREKIEGLTVGPDQYHYSVHKKGALKYKVIFFALAVLYSVLAVILYFKTFSWSFSFLFGDINHAIKGLSCIFCGVIALSSLKLCISMTAEKQAANHLYKRAKLRIRQAYNRKTLNFGIKNLLPLTFAPKEIKALKQYYLDCVEKIREIRDETIHLLDQIRKSNQEKREDLFNQAVLEMNDRIHLLVDTFNSASHQRILALF